jgi:hypothetical protein
MTSRSKVLSPGSAVVSSGSTPAFPGSAVSACLRRNFAPFKVPSLLEHDLPSIPSVTSGSTVPSSCSTVGFASATQSPSLGENLPSSAAHALGLQRPVFRFHSLFGRSA